MYRNVYRSAKADRPAGKCGARIFQFFTLALAVWSVTPINASAFTTQSTSTTPAPAQSGRGGGYQRSGQHRSKQARNDARVERLAKQLDLTEAQKVALKRLLASEQAQSDRLWNDQQIDPIDRMTKLKAVQEESRKQFRTFLTDEQRKKYDDLLHQPSRQNPSQPASH